jgi:hypothetical protein
LARAHERAAAAEKRQLAGELARLVRRDLVFERTRRMHDLHLALTHDVPRHVLVALLEDDRAVGIRYDLAERLHARELRGGETREHLRATKRELTERGERDRVAHGTARIAQRDPAATSSLPRPRL